MKGPLLPGRVRIRLSSLSCDRVPDKLARAGIDVFRVRREGKNLLSLEVSRKDGEKAFAILRGACYNIEEVRERGLAFAYKKCVAHIGLILGTLLFVLAAGGFQRRVLRVEVVGSGAYYGREVRETLAAGGVTFLSAMPRDLNAFSAELLSLPNVAFCELRASGGVLTVQLEVSGEHSPLACVPLLVPAKGRVEELTVLRGTPCVQVGDEVEKGQTAVEPFADYGGARRQVAVIGRVKISYPVQAEYSGTEEEARAQALIDFGESELTYTPTERGFAVTGRAFASASLNLG